MDSARNKNFLKVYKFAFYIFLFIYFCFLIYTTFKINISEDETYTLNTTHRNLAGVIKQSYNFEAQPPVYFILMSWWRKIDSGIFFTKLFSVIFIGFSAIIFQRLCLLFLSSKTSSYYLTAIFLLNPFAVWAALEIRLYAFLIFLSTISIYLFYQFQFRENKKYLYGLIIVSLIGIYTQYFFTFLIFTFSLILLITKGWKFFLTFCLYALPLLFLFLPNLIYLQDQISLQKSHNVHQFPISKIYAILYTPQSLLLSINLIPNIWINRFIRLFFLLGLIVIYIKLIQVAPPYSSSNVLRKYNTIIFSICILIFSFFFVFLISGVGYESKYMTVVYPLFILILTIFDRVNYPEKPFVYPLIIIYFIILLVIKYCNPVKTYDFKSAAKFIEKIERSNEPILIYRPAIALPLDYYYEGKNNLVPIPHPVNFDSSYLINIEDTNQLKNAINNAGINSKGYILVSDTTLFEGVLFMNRKMISNYIYAHYKVSLDTLFYGRSKRKPLRVMTFEKKVNAQGNR